MNKKEDTFTIFKDSASIAFHNNASEVNCRNRWDGSLPHYGIFHRTMNYLESIGFAVSKDPRIEGIINVCPKITGMEFLKTAWSSRRADIQPGLKLNSFKISIMKIHTAVIVILISLTRCHI